MRPRGTQNGSQNRDNVIWGQECSQGITKIGFPQCRPPLGEDFWLPQGTPKSTKNGTLGENGVPEQSFFRFLLRRALQPTFSSIFHRFLTKKSMYFSLLFSSHPCFFLDMATFTIVCFFLIETYFFIFYFFVFFCKK